MTGIFSQISACFTKFAKKCREDPAAEVYLEPFQTYMIEPFARIVHGLGINAPS